MTPKKNGIIAEPRIRVRYAETDKMGVVYHSNFIVWFEVGRVELLRQIGFSYREMETHDDCHIAVVDVRCRYKSPAYYDDELIVRTRLKNLRGNLMVFDYDVVRVTDGVTLAEGETTHLVVNSKMEKTVLPDKYVKAFSTAVARDGDAASSTSGKTNG
jgi:acyl-CoA thioester hydrolase